MRFSFRLYGLCLLLLIAGANLHAQWRPLDKPFGTNVFHLFEAEGTLLASSPTGIYWSDDEGENWLQVTVSANARTFLRVGDVVYAGTESGIITSDQTGRNWSQLRSDLPEGSVMALAYDGTRLYAGSFGMGLHFSTDNGQSWTADNTGLPSTYVSSLAAIGSQVFVSLTNSFGTEDGGIFTRSTSGSWTRLTQLNTGELIVVGTTLFAVHWEGLYRSEDLGQTWTLLSPPDEATFFSTISSDGSAIYAGTNDKGIFRSTDNGNTWTYVGTLETPVSYLLIRDNALLAGTPYDGVFISNDNGTSWQASNTGIKSTLTITALTAENNSLYAVSESPNRLYKSSDNSTTWSLVAYPPSTTSVLTSVAVVNSTLLAGSSMEGVFNSDVNGTSWQQSAGIPAKTWITGFFRDGSTILAGAYPMTSPLEIRPGIYISKDVGLTWTATDLTQVAYSFTRHNGALYAGLTRDLMVSTDGGEHWTPTGANTFNDNDLYALASNGPALFAGSYSHGIQVSYDNGVTWQRSSDIQLANASVLSFAVYGRTVFAATSNGVFKTENDGASWESVSMGMESMETIEVTALAIAGENLYAGTRGASVWWRPLIEMTVTSVADKTPQQVEYSLLPHPLSSSLLLQLCNTCELHNASLTLSTMSGQRVRTTGNLYGTSVSIDRGDLATGVYAFTLEEAGRVVTSGTIVVE